MIVFKKICFISALTTVVVLVLAITASAENGDVCGKIYSTDILALVNGQPIESYNIGGKTAILAEDLYYYYDGNSYGYHVDYNDEKRLLTLNTYWFNIYDYYFEKRGISIERGKVGIVLGNIYDTDIKVICNGYEIKGYNIGGKTAICIEDLGTLDDSANSEFGYSKYLANFTWDEGTRTVELNTPFSNLDEIDFQHGVHSYEFSFKDNVLTAQYDPLNNYYNYPTINEDNLSAEFLEDYFILKPFYIKIGDLEYEAGVCVRSKTWQNEFTFYHVNDPVKTRDLLFSSIPPRKTYDEAIDYLYSLSDFTVVEKLDNDEYTVLRLAKNDAEPAWYMYAAAKKTGGYLNFYTEFHYEEMSMEFDGNTVTVRVYPFGGPHGPVTMQCSLNLDDMQF